MILKFIKSGYEKIKGALTKAGSTLGNKIRSLFQGSIDEETLEGLEQLFYEADLGVQTSIELTEKVKEMYRENPSLEGNSLIAALREEIVNILKKNEKPQVETQKGSGPLVILVVGVNGNGKTTSVAKIAKRHSDQGNKVIIAATDTFRAAGIEQLDIWAQRLNVDIVKGAPKSDPAAVAYDAVSAALARGADVVIIDTAGRLHTRDDLMKELEKIRKACNKVIPNSPHETFLVLDATIGQNAIDQAKIFNQFTPITGLLLTKLDGTAKGGIVINIQTQLGIPVKFVGTGEGIEDLQPFEAETFVRALLD